MHLTRLFTVVPSLLLLLACTTDKATEYSGSAKDDTVADSAGRLTLTLWSHTDTSFSGYVRVDPPLTLSGGAYAWHEGRALKFASVSTAGDTVVWSSHQTGDSIGGRYEVTGGPAEGRIGTWRAVRSAGPSVAKGTLARPTPPASLLSPDGLLALAILIVAITLAVRWIRFAPPGTLPADTPEARVSGWLAFFVFGQVVTLFITLAKLPEVLSPLDSEVWEMTSVVPAMRSLLVIERLIIVVQILASLIGVYLIVKAKHYAPRFYRAYLAAMAIYAAIDILGGMLLLARYKTMFSPETLSEILPDMSSARTANLRLLVFSMAWSLYWMKSLKVKARFGDESAIMAPASGTS